MGFALQEQALRAAGCDVVRAEKASGTSRADRNELATLLDFLRRGDTLVVTRIDRLARSIKDLQDIVYTLKGRGVTLKANEQLIDLRADALNLKTGHLLAARVNQGIVTISLVRQLVVV